MKITVDTKEDSTEDLKHMIKMLTALVESRGGSSNYGNDMPGMMNMFGSDAPSSSASSAPSPQQDQSPSSIFNMDIPSASPPQPEKSSSSMFNIFGQEEKKKEEDDYGIPKIIEYR
jgi:hypothetical protein